MFFHKAITIAALSAIASFAYADSAHAITFKMTPGTTGLNGEINQGAFSEFSQNKDVVTIDFNDGTMPTSGFAKYSFDGNGSSSVVSDVWDPVGSQGQENTSKYPEVFEGNKVVINLEKTLNYFGIDWGAAHSGNVFSFFKGDNLIKSFTTADIDKAGGFAFYSPLHPGINEDGAKKVGDNYYQGNGYTHFYSEGTNDIFDKIEISQIGGGGFETDNHSFHAGTDRFTGFDPKSVPEPGVAVGLLAFCGMFLRRKNQKSVLG